MNSKSEFSLVIASLPSYAARLQAQCDTPWIRTCTLGQVCHIAMCLSRQSNCGTEAQILEGFLYPCWTSPSEALLTSMFLPKSKIHKSSQDAHPGRSMDILWYREQRCEISGKSLDFRKRKGGPEGPKAGDICDRLRQGLAGSSQAPNCSSSQPTHGDTHPYSPGLACIPPWSLPVELAGDPNTPSQEIPGTVITNTDQITRKMGENVA